MSLLKCPVHGKFEPCELCPTSRQIPQPPPPPANQAEKGPYKSLYGVGTAFVVHPDGDTTKLSNNQSVPSLTCDDIVRLLNSAWLAATLAERKACGEIARKHECDWCYCNMKIAKQIESRGGV